MSMRFSSLLIGVCVISLFVFGVVMGVRAARPWMEEKVEYFTYGYVLPENVERRSADIDGERVSFLVFHLPETMTWRLENDPSSPKIVREWRDVLGASVVLNGSYFTHTYEPSGYYVHNGTRNGVCPMLSSDYDTAFGYTFSVWIDDADQLQFGSTSEHPELCHGMEYVPPDTFASFPTIVRDDVSAIEKDSELKARRTMLAKTIEGEKQIIITESGEVTLYDVAEWLVAQPEMYEIVGNLDGGPSTGISISNGLDAPIDIPSAIVPNVIVGEYEKRM